MWGRQRWCVRSGRWWCWWWRLLWWPGWCGCRDARLPGSMKLSGFSIREEPGPNDDPDAFRCFERETVAAGWRYVHGQLAKGPVMELFGTDVERASLDGSE